MKRIEIADTDFKRLQDLAKQHLVNPDDITDEFRASVNSGIMATMITKVLDQYEANNTATPVQVGNSPESVPPLISRTDKTHHTFDKTTIPNMRHTKLMKGSFGQSSPKAATWNGMVELVLVAVFGSSGSVEELQRVSGANVVQGKKDDAGYRHVPEHDFSYQGVSATDAVEVIRRCARALTCPAHIEFEWRHKQGTLHPGETATLDL